VLSPLLRRCKRDALFRGAEAKEARARAPTVSRAEKYDLGAISGAMAASNEETRPRAGRYSRGHDGALLCRGEGGTQKLMALRVARDAITEEWWSNAMRHGRRVISMLFLPVMHSNARANTHECVSTHGVGISRTDLLNVKVSPLRYGSLLVVHKVRSRRYRGVDVSRKNFIKRITLCLCDVIHRNL